MFAYFLLKKLERTTNAMYDVVVESESNPVDTTVTKKRLDASYDIKKTIGEMKSVFGKELDEVRESEAAYNCNLENGYYDKGLGKIEGWFLAKYIKINFQIYREYFKILNSVELRLNWILVKLERLA